MYLTTKKCFNAQWNFLVKQEKTEILDVIETINLAVKKFIETNGSDIYHLFSIYPSSLMKGTFGDVDFYMKWDGGMVFVFMEKEKTSVVLSGPSANFDYENWAMKSIDGNSEDVKNLIKTVNENWHIRKIKESYEKISNPIFLENLTGKKN